MKYSQPWYVKAMLALVFLATSASFAAHEAQAQALIDASNPQAILEIAKGYGSAALITDNDGDPEIAGRMEGIPYHVWFYGCSNGRDCETIQFVTAWDSDRVSLSDVNQWNKGTVFVSAYLTDEGHPVLKMTVNLEGGVSRVNLDDTFDWWKVLLVRFKNKFNL